MIGFINGLLFSIHKLEHDSDWILIKDNPPKKNTSLLFSFSDGSVAEGEYKKCGLVVQYRWNCTRDDAVAWQPLPQSHKKEGDAI